MMKLRSLAHQNTGIGHPQLEIVSNEYVVALKMTRQKKTHSKYYNILIEIEIIVKLST